MSARFVIVPYSGREVSIPFPRILTQVRSLACRSLAISRTKECVPADVTKAGDMLQELEGPGFCCAAGFPLSTFNV